MGRVADEWDSFLQQVVYPTYAVNWFQAEGRREDGGWIAQVPCQCTKDFRMDYASGGPCPEGRLVALEQRAKPVGGKWWTSTGHAHHILSRARRPDLRYDMDNIALVDPACHARIHAAKEVSS
jgi:hypothetical protein